MRATTITPRSVKGIGAAQDLAINGAPPAFDQPLHVGRPNIGARDLFMKYAAEILDRQWLSNNGPFVQEFERRIEEHLGVKHCVAMCNGTVALEIAIRALGLKGEVIVPSYTFIATAHALHWQEITPVFADIDPSTHTLDPDSVCRMITPRTTALSASIYGDAVRLFTNCRRLPTGTVSSSCSTLRMPSVVHTGES